MIDEANRLRFAFSQEESKSFLTYTAKYLSSPANKDSAKLDAAFRTRTMQWE